MKKDVIVESNKKDLVDLRNQLDRLVEAERIDSEKVLKLSQELDTLIVGYYHMRACAPENYLSE